jgi:hypothetical protein
MFLTAAVILFAIAALFGGAMALMHFLGKTPPAMALAVLHGIFVVSGFGALFGVVWPNFNGRPTWALTDFGLAAIGGSAMVLGWRAKALPSALVLIHGGVALVAFAVLLSALLGS